MGADPYTKDYKDGETPLHKAAAQGHPRVINILLDAGNHTDGTLIIVSISRPAVELFQFDPLNAQSIGL